MLIAKVAFVFLFLFLPFFLQPLEPSEDPDEDFFESFLRLSFLFGLLPLAAGELDRSFFRVLLLFFPFFFGDAEGPGERLAGVPESSRC